MNIFFLLSGLLLTFLSVTHAVWGEKKLFNSIGKMCLEQELIISFYVPWHQLTFILFSKGRVAAFKR